MLTTACDAPEIMPWAVGHHGDLFARTRMCNRVDGRHVHFVVLAELCSASRTQRDSVPTDCPKLCTVSMAKHLGRWL